MAGPRGVTLSRSSTVLPRRAYVASTVDVLRSTTNLHREWTRVRLVIFMYYAGTECHCYARHSMCIVQGAGAFEGLAAHQTQTFLLAGRQAIRARMPPVGHAVSHFCDLPEVLKCWRDHPYSNGTVQHSKCCFPQFGIGGREWFFSLHLHRSSIGSSHPSIKQCSKHYIAL